MPGKDVERKAWLARSPAWLLLLALAAACGGRSEPLELRSGRLRAVFTDNEAYPGHEAGYHGVAELYLGKSPRSAFVPGTSGLNLEHIFSGDAASYGWDMFEPRLAPMRLVRLGERSAELRQERTANWPLETTITYELAGRNAIDFTVRCVPRADAWSKHGYIGLFFASNVLVESRGERAIYFIGRRRARGVSWEPLWIRHHSLRHGERSCHRPAGSPWDPRLDPGFPLKLVSGLSQWEYLYPFYYGITHRKALVFMFERPSAEGEIRFTHSPYGGGNANPAWDFMYLKRGYRVGEEFSFRGRMVYRAFKTPAQIVRAYEAWSGESVQRPAEPPSVPPARAAGAVSVVAPGKPAGPPG